MDRNPGNKESRKTWRRDRHLCSRDHLPTRPLAGCPFLNPTHTPPSSPPPRRRRRFPHPIPSLLSSSFLTHPLSLSSAPDLPPLLPLPPCECPLSRLFHIRWNSIWQKKKLLLGRMYKCVIYMPACVNVLVVVRDLFSSLISVYYGSQFSLMCQLVYLRWYFVTMRACLSVLFTQCYKERYAVYVWINMRERLGKGPLPPPW